MSAPKTSEPGQTRRVRKLRFRIGEADQLQSLRRDPNLIAVETEQGRRRTLAGLWFFLALGLMFTTAGVQRFLAGNTTPADPLWWAAWTVEPMFAGLLIVLLNFEATILIHGIAPDLLALSRLKRILLGSTMFMNVVPQLAPLLSGQWAAFNPASAFVHAAIPAIVYYLAEVIPVIQARCREVIHTAYTEAAANTTAAVEQVEAPPEPAGIDPVGPEPSGTLPAPEPEPEPASAPAPVRATSMRLPAPVLDKLTRTRDQAVNEGRDFTAADVQRAVRVSDETADQLVAELSRTNGHALT